LRHLKGGEPRHQPQRSDPDRGGEVHLRAALRLADLGAGIGQSVEHVGNDPMQGLPLGGEMQRPDFAPEQAYAQLLFERLDLAADGRLREVKFARRPGKAEMTSCGIETLERIERRQAPAGIVHAPSNECK